MSDDGYAQDKNFGASLFLPEDKNKELSFYCSRGKQISDLPLYHNI